MTGGAEIDRRSDLLCRRIGYTAAGLMTSPLAPPIGALMGSRLAVAALVSTSLSLELGADNQDQSVEYLPTEPCEVTDPA